VYRTVLHKDKHSFITAFTKALSLSPPQNKAKTHFTCPIALNLNCDNPFGPLSWHRSLIGRYGSKGESWKDKVLFLLDVKNSLLLWGVRLRAGLGQDSLLSPSLSSWLTDSPGMCLCLWLLHFSVDSGLFFFLFLVQSYIRGLRSRDCLWLMVRGENMEWVELYAMFCYIIEWRFKGTLRLPWNIENFQFGIHCFVWR
jgi:hypothetical protein